MPPSGGELTAQVAHTLAEPRAAAPAEILPLTSTSEVYVPPRAQAYNKFSFDFPEPSVAFAGFRFGFLVFTEENAYALDPALMAAERSDDAMTITCTGFTWAGGQEKVAGRLTARFQRSAGTIEWHAAVEMAMPDQDRDRDHSRCSARSSGVWRRRWRPVER